VSTTPLAPEDAARLTEFARACKAAARSVLLYPDGHPAITAGLGRIVQVTSRESLPGPLRLTVLADALGLDGRQTARPDASLGELATLLHAHRVGELTVHPGGDADGWRRFLLLLGQTPDAVRADGGIAHVWTATGIPHLEIREVDYAEVLRERPGGLPAIWDDIVAKCLEGSPLGAGDDTVRALLDAALDTARLTEILTVLDAQAAAAGVGSERRTAALVAILSGMTEVVERHTPDQFEATARAMAEAIGQLSPDMLLSVLAERERGDAATSPLVESIAGRMSDETKARFLARHAADDQQPIERLAQAFHALVPDAEHQERLLALAHDQLASTPFGSQQGFEERWSEVAGKLLQSYSDEPYVSDAYARELSSARGRAVTLEQAGDDPPDRISAWLDTVATNELRKLDLALMLDLVRLEDDPERRATLVGPLVAFLEDLLLVGDFDAAAQLLGPIAADARPQAPVARRTTAGRVTDGLVKGPMLHHVIAHLPTIDAAQFEQVKALCVSIGDGLVTPLAEAIATEERTRTRERLTAILLAFGAAGRREVERLKSASNPAVRRAAVQLLREFGGADALAELTDLLGDREPHVQREAVRAILNIGGEPAYRVLEQALTEGTPQARDTIMQALGAVRDDRSAAVLARVIRHVDHRGPLGTIYQQAVDLLGGLRDPEGVAALRDALYRGEWWAPRRTARLRQAAAAALARVGTPEAAAILDEAARSGPRGVRTAAGGARGGVRHHA
jgi:HEAT repeat protein